MRAYPRIVMGIDMAVADGYSTIQFDGVVESDGASDATTELPIIYTLKFPYKHCSNNQATYLKIACGPSVLVIFLIGNPILRSAKANFCFETNTLRCASLDHTPGFPLTYKKPKLTTHSPPHVGANLVVPNEVLQAIEKVSVFIGFPPSVPVVPSNSCIRDGKYSPNQEPTEAKPHSYFQGTPNPEPLLTQCVTTGSVCSPSLVAGNSTTRTVVDDILGVTKNHCAFTPTDQYIEYVAAFPGATRRPIHLGTNMA